MIEVKSFNEWQHIVAEHDQLVLYVKVSNCSVCEGLFPQIEAIETDYATPFYWVNATEVPEMAGQLSLFTAPVVLLLAEQKEYARFARFVPMEELKKRLHELALLEG